MKLCRRFAALLCACLFSLLCAVPAGAASTSPAAPDAAGEPGPWRAMWVSTVYHLDYPSVPTTSAASLRRDADAILDGCREMGMTAVILQVRPCADALYPSAIFPWSAALTGSQGTAPQEGFDPLSYWIEGAHARGLELHAWINPYRITKKGEEFAALAKDNPAKAHPGWVVRHTDGNYYFNPGIPQVRELVKAGVQEILDNYAVDGIHLDDYFYPGTDFDDAAAFARYGDGFSSLGNWRRHNVNLLVRELGELVRESGKPCAYGISPMGVWANSASLPEGSDTLGGETYFTHFADSKKWVENGWLDYICPQIYWNIGHSKADYETLARWWSSVVEGTGVKLYIGMADYQAGAKDPQSPWHGIGEVRRQLQLNRTLPQVSGEAHFRYQLIAANPELVEYYRQSAK